MILILAYNAPMVIQLKPTIAIAIALPMNTNKQIFLVYQEMPFENFGLVPNVL